MRGVGGQRLALTVVPQDRGASATIGVTPGEARRSVPIGVAARDALVGQWALGWSGEVGYDRALDASGLGRARGERFLAFALALSWIARVQLAPWSFFDGGRLLALVIETLVRRPLPRVIAKAWNLVVIVGVVVLVLLRHAPG